MRRLFARFTGAETMGRNCWRWRCRLTMSAEGDGWNGYLGEQEKKGERSFDDTCDLGW